jgi:hypothetical protein
MRGSLSRARRGELGARLTSSAVATCGWVRRLPYCICFRRKVAGCIGGLGILFGVKKIVT